MEVKWWKWFINKLMDTRGLVGEDIDADLGDEDSANEGGEGQDSDSDGEENEVEYQLDEDGEQVLDEDGNPIPVETEETEEETEKPDHKKSASERIQQLANEKRELAARLEKLEQQFAVKEQEKPDYYDVDMDAVNEYIQKTSDQIEELKLEGKFLAAKKIELAQTKLISDLEANDLKRQAYLDRQGKSKSETDQTAKLLGEVDRAAEFYREANKIAPEVWNKMGLWFAEKCKSDPLLGREFSERIETQSRIAAVKWAHEYTVKNMGIKEKESINQKNKNKETASSASPKQGSGKSNVVDLSKALEEAKATGTAEGWAKYQGLKRQAQR